MRRFVDSDHRSTAPEHSEPGRRVPRLPDKLRARMLGARAVDANRPESFFASALEASPVAYVMTNAAGEIVLVNAGTEALFGYERGDLLGRRVEMLIPEHLRAGHLQHRLDYLTRALPRPMGSGPRLVGLRKDGSEVAVEIALSPVETDDGLYVLAAIVDNTERARAEQKLRTSQERLELVARATNDAIWDWDLMTGTVWWNDTYDALYGPRPESMSQTWNWITERVHPEDRDEILESVRIALDGDAEHWQREYRFRRRDGSWATVVDRAHILRDDKGLPTRMLGAMLDVTDRRRDESGMRRMASIIEEADDAILSKNLDGVITTWNRGAERIFGYTQQEIRGKNVGILYPPERGDEQESILARIRGGERVDHFETTRLRKDGKLVHLSVTISPVRDGRGAIVGASAIYRDISELKAAQEQLEQVNESLEERIAERTAVARQRAADLRRLAAKLSRAEHDERARLARMLHDNVQQLLLAARLKLAHLRIAGDSRRQRKVDEVEELLTDCLRTTRDLSHELSPAVLQVGTIVEIVDWLGEWFGDKHGLRVDVEPGEGIPELPENLRVFLFWAVRELLFNAVKYSGSQRARVGLWFEDARLTVRVEDGGEAFRPRAVEERLARGEAFGLFNIRERIENLQGELEIDRTERGGACFRLYVPVRETPEERS